MAITRHEDVPLFQSYYRPDRFKEYQGLPNLKCVFCGKRSPIPFDMENHIYLDHREPRYVYLTKIMEEKKERRTI